MDISELVNQHIDAAFYAKREAEPARNYLGASLAGDECLRKLQFSYMHTPADRVPAPNMLRIWQTGHAFEAELGNWLRMAGFDLKILDPEHGGQFGWSILDDEGQGHIDGIIRGGPPGLQYPCLWEAKALNRKGWQDLKKNGLAISKPVYHAQVALNQAYLELHEHPALFTALNKDTSELLHLLVPFDQQLAQRTSDKMAMVIDASKNQELLPRAFNDETHYKCRWCDWNVKCWSMKR